MNFRILFGALALFLLPLMAQAACTGPAAPEGRITYNNDYHNLQYCNGSAWVSFGAIDPGAGGSGCTGPTGAERLMIYNTDQHVYQYCDGTNWMQVGGYAPSGCGVTGSKTPAQIFGTDLIAWYDASDAASITQSSGAVSQWNDKSGNGYNLTQATSGYRPIYSATGSVNGKPAITFDGTDDYLSVTGITGLSAGVVTAAVVGSETSAAYNTRLLELVDSTQSFDYDNYTSLVLFNGQSMASERNGGSGTIGFNLTYGTQYRWYTMLTGSQIITTANGWMQNNTVASSSGPLGTSMDLFVAYGKGIGVSFSGKFSEIVITKVTPTVSQQADLDTYFQLKW